MGKRLIHVVDDEEAIRRSIGFLLRTSGFAVEAYESGIAFLREAEAAEPGCILLDVRMPHIDGIAVQEELNARGVTMPVIVLTGHGDISLAVRAMKAGAVDFIEKPFEKASLIEAIGRAFDRLDRHEEASVSEQDAKVRIAALTACERDVLRSLVRGLSNTTIAFDLGIPPRAVEVQRASCMTKLGVGSLSEALRIAFAAGLGT